MTFVRDLKMGKSYEMKLLDLIEYDSYKQAEGRFKDWDMEIHYQGETITFECKADTFAKRTGQIAIEYECNGKPSGITTTKADYWVHFFAGSNKYLMIPTDELRAVIDGNGYARKCSGGDRWASRLYIIDAEKFATYADEY